MNPQFPGTAPSSEEIKHSNIIYRVDASIDRIYYSMNRFQFSVDRVHSLIQPQFATTIS